MLKMAFYGFLISKGQRAVTNKTSQLCFVNYYLKDSCKPQFFQQFSGPGVCLGYALERPCHSKFRQATWPKE